MAEARLRTLMSEVALPAVAERITVGEAGERQVRQLATRGRKVSTLAAYRTHLRVHLGPHFGDKPLSRISKDDVEEFVLVCLEGGQSVKSVRNYLGFLHGIFEFALRQGWVVANPCRTAEKPVAPEANPDIRFLDQTELDALLGATVKPHGRRKPGTDARSRRVKELRDGEGMSWKAIAADIGVAQSTAIYLYRVELDAGEPDDPLDRVDRALYLAAAMTGMRQGELFALRWMDVDWLAHRVRVRRNYVHGRFGTPKSKRSSRSIPLADQVARELELLFQASSFQGDEDLVFGHPHTGRPLDRSRTLKRFKAALARAGVREIRFHDLRHLVDAGVMRPV